MRIVRCRMKPSAAASLGDSRKLKANLSKSRDLATSRTDEVEMEASEEVVHVCECVCVSVCVSAHRDRVRC
jgi:hypothetical protein